MDGKTAVGSERSTNYLFIHSWETDYISYGIRWMNISLSTYSFRHEITSMSEKSVRGEIWLHGCDIASIAQFLHFISTCLLIKKMNRGKGRQKRGVFCI